MAGKCQSQIILKSFIQCFTKIGSCSSKAEEDPSDTIKLEAEQAMAKLRMLGKRGWRRNAVYYSTKEDMMIIRHVLKNSKHKATGITLWKQLAKSLKDRTYWSLKGRFDRKIINQLDKYNLTDKEVKYLRESAGHAARRRISKHKYQRHRDNNCSRKCLNMKGKLPSSTNILLLPDNEDVFVSNGEGIANDEEDDVIWNEMYRRKLYTSSEDEDQEKNEDKICNKNILTALSESDNDLSVRNIYKNKRNKNLITVCKNLQTNVIKTFDDEIERMVNKIEDEECMIEDEGIAGHKELQNYKLKQTEIAGNFEREDYHNFVNNYFEMNNKSSSNEKKILYKDNAEMTQVKENSKQQNNIKRQMNKGIKNNGNNDLYFKSLSDSSTSFNLNFRNNLQPANHKDNANHMYVSERKSFSSLEEDNAGTNIMYIRKLRTSPEDEDRDLNKENMSNNKTYKRKLSTSPEHQELNEENMFNKNNISAMYGENSKTSVAKISENIRSKNLISLCKNKRTKVKRIFESKGRYVLNSFEDSSMDEDSEQNFSLNQLEDSDGESQIKEKDSANERKRHTGVTPITGNNKEYNDVEKHDFPKDKVSRKENNNFNDLCLPLSCEMEQNKQNEEVINRNASKEIANNQGNTDKNVEQISTVDDIKFNYSKVKETESKRKVKKRVSFSWDLCSYITFDSQEEWDECEESQTSRHDKEICNEESLQQTNGISYTELKVCNGVSRRSKSTESSTSDVSVNHNTVDTLSSLSFQDLGHLLDSPYNLDTPSVKLVPYEESPYDSDTPSVELVPYEKSLCYSDMPSVKLVPYEESPYDSDTPSVELVPYEKSLCYSDMPSVKLVPYEESPYDSDTPSVELVPFEESP